MRWKNFELCMEIAGVSILLSKNIEEKNPLLKISAGDLCFKFIWKF